MDLLQFISSIVVACVPAIFTYLGMRQELKKNNNKVINGELCLLRTQILKMYYANRENKTLNQYERQNLEELYAAYLALGGNSFAKSLYEKMSQWDVVQ